MPGTEEFRFVAGRACLDLANTVSGRRGTAARRDRVEDYDDLLLWVAQRQLLTEAELKSLRAMSKRDRTGVQKALNRTLALRETVYAIFAAAAARKPISQEALDLLNREMIDATANLRLEAKGRKFERLLSVEASGLCLPLHLIAQDAIDLLTSQQLDEVRECSVESCTWLFLDKTRNHSRLWCDMRVCGNRIKQARLRKKRSRKDSARANARGSRSRLDRRSPDRSR